MKAAPFVRVKAKFTVKKRRMLLPKTLTYGEFDRDFNFDSHDWSHSAVLMKEEGEKK